MRRAFALILIALSLAAFPAEKAFASLAGTAAEKVVRITAGILEGGKSLADNLKSSFGISGRVGKIAGRFGDDGARIANRLGEKGVRFLADFGDEGVSLVGKFGDEVVDLSSRNRKRLVRLSGKVDDDLLRLAVKEGDEGIERLARGVMKKNPIRKALSFLGRHLEALVIAIGGLWVLDFFRSLPGWLKNLLEFLVFLGVFGPLISWVAIRLIRCWRSIARALKTSENEGGSLAVSRQRPEKAHSGHLLARPGLLLFLAAFSAALFFWAVSVARFPGQETGDETSPVTFAGENGRGAAETPEERFERINGGLQAEWAEETARLRRDMDALVSARLDSVHGKWVSKERMDALCEAYFGYWQGWQFNFRQFQDLFVKGSPHAQEEMSSIVNETVLFDLEGDMNDLYLDLEDLLNEKVNAFTERVERAFSDEFSEEEIASLTGRLEFGSLSATPSEFMAIVRTGTTAVDFFMTDKVVEEIFRRLALHFGRQGGTLVATELVGKSAVQVFSISAAGIAKFACGLALGLALDYAVSKGVRLATEKDFREGFTAALEEQEQLLLQAWQGGIAEVFEVSSLQARN